MSEIVPVIMCGGSGTRLWPASRKAQPKQFLPLIQGRSPFQETLLRVRAEGFARPVVVTGSDYRFVAAEQASKVDVAVDILLEPEGRDSGPALAVAAVHAGRRDGESVPVLALAADHLVHDVEGFRATVAAALPAARQGYIVTFGIVPDAPSDAFGYIEVGATLEDVEPVRAAKRFIEKPDQGEAARLVSAGCLWNSGNFLCHADTLLDAYARQDADTVSATRDAVAQAVTDLDFVRVDTEAFARTTKRSIDYAVMENADNVAVIEARFDWSDIGSWDTMSRVFENEDDNAVDGPVVAIEARGNVVHSSGVLVALAGVDNLVVVVTDDAVLVADRRAGHLMRSLVAKVREHDPVLVDEPLQSFRPWGRP